MRKSMLAVLLVAGMVLFSGCGAKDADATTEQPAVTSGAEETAAETEIPVETTTEAPKAEKKMVSAAEFDTLMSTMPVPVVSTEFVIQDDQYKALYPDMLNAVIQNNTDFDIKDAVLAFAAWDENNLPIKLKGQMDFTGENYIKEVNYGDINLVPGQTFGENNGFSLAEGFSVATVKAVVISIEGFDGEKWENPYYGAFKTLYEGVKLADDLSVEIEESEIQIAAGSGSQDAPAISAAELAQQLSGQDMSVVSCSYVVQDDQYKALYPDMLQAIIVNNTEKDIKDAVVGFAAWDANGLPVKIKGQISFNDPAYFIKVNYEGINLVSGQTYGDGQGFSLAEGQNITTVKAIVVSYETFDGEKWENPCLKDFQALYEGTRFAE